MAVHAQYSPSRLSRIIACPGSMYMCADIKDKPSIYAQEGTRLHSLTEQALSPELDTENFLKTQSEEDAQIVGECVAYVNGILSTLESPDIFREIKVSLERWGLPEVWGTLDVGVFDYKRNEVHIIDWKFGKNVQVYATNNPQLWAYAAGFMNWPTRFKTATMHIFQPYQDHVDTQTVSINELYSWVHNILATAIMDSTVNPPILNPGEDQCRWCPARSTCKARYSMALNDAEYVFGVMEAGKHTISPEEMRDILDLWPRLEQAIKDFKLYAKRELERGKSFPGYKLVNGRTTRNWKDEKAAIEWLANNTPIEDLFVSKPLSPHMAENKYRKLKKDQAFKDLINVSPGKSTLVPNSDPRDAISASNSAAQAFAAYKKDDSIILT